MLKQVVYCLAFLALLASLTACQSYQAAPLDAQAVLAATRTLDLQHFVVERAAPGQAGAAAEHGFDASDGLNEDEVIAVALTLNPDLRARRAETGEAQAVLISAGLWPNPVLSVGPQWGMGGFSGYSLNIDAIFQLLRPGERQALQQGARAQAQEINAQIVAAEFALVAAVRQQLLAVLAAERTSALLQDALTLSARTLELAGKQRQIGEGNLLQLSLAELDAAQTRRAWRQGQTDLRLQLQQLNHLLGLGTEYPLQLSGLGQPLTIAVLDDVTDAQLEQRMLAGRFELRAAEAAYQKAEQDLRLAVIQQYPRLGIGPAFTRELDASTSLGPAISLELPIFHQNQGEIAQKAAARNRLQAQYAALLYRLRAEAFAARAAVRAARAEVQVQEQEVLPLLQRSQELFDSAYRARELRILDWLPAQQRTLDARRQYLDALVGYRQAVIQLEAALGQSLATTAASTTPAASATAATPTTPVSPPTTLQNPGGVQP